jgi:hypothetical protein
MRNQKKNIDQLEKLLGTAYRSRQLPDLPPGWHKTVMQDIRKLDRTAKPRIKRLERWFPMPVVYRFAGAGCVAALALMAFAWLSGGSLDLELSQLMMNDPFGLASLLLVVL